MHRHTHTAVKFQSIMHAFVLFSRHTIVADRVVVECVCGRLLGTDIESIFCIPIDLRFDEYILRIIFKVVHSLNWPHRITAI